MRTVAIIPGWAEGPWQARQLATELSRNGFKLTDNTNNADVVIAHSLGCYLVPKDSSSELVMLVGLPHWPGRPILSSLMRKLAFEAQEHKSSKNLSWWLNKTAHNLLYVLRYPKLTWAAIFERKLANLTKISNVLLVRNERDSFLDPGVLDSLKAERNYKLIDLSGSHDDIWSNPKPYIDLILKEL